MSDDTRPDNAADPDFTTEPERSIDEAELRDPADIIEDIGPEDETAEETMEGMEEYGYNQLSETYFASGAYQDSTQPDTWMNEEAQERMNVDRDANDELDEDLS
jgi:hypothetical protein